MIWAYIGLIIWSVFLLICVGNGGKRTREDNGYETITAWMIPLILTSTMLLAWGIILAVNETVRLYS